MARARTGFMHGLYVWLVIFLGCGLLVSMLRLQPVDIDFLREYLVFLVLGVLAEWFVVSLPQGSLSVGFAVVLTSFLLFDTSATVLISVLSALLGNLVISKDGSFRTTLFNGAQYTISAVGAAYAYYYVGGLTSDKISVPNILPLLVFVLSYFVINHLLVNIFLWPSCRHYTWSMWGAALKWDIYTYLFSTPVGILMFLIYNKTGLLGAALLFIPVLTLKYLLRLYINLEMANRELSVLYGVAQSLGASLDMAETLGLILTESRKVVSYHTGIIYLWHEEEQLLIPSAIRSPYADKLKKISFSLDEGIVGMVAKTGQPEIVYDTKKDRRLRSMPGITQFLRSLLVVPLMVEKKIIGVVTIGKKEPYAYGPKHMQILTILGGQAAVAMANALLYKKIEKLAITDGLTKVYNHRYFYKKFEEEYQRSQRYGCKFSVIMIDIDYFKRFNDEFGHKAGDTALFTVAKIIKTNTRNIDTVARYGGEEFAILLPETDSGDAKIVAERIRKAISETVFRIADDKPPVGVTVSIGVSSYPADTKDPQQVVELADQALYYSKEHGKNRVTVWSQMNLTPANKES
ncbi:sensor domain-containing diguanylate cyclase [Thermincola potens]|uniref:Diguanylate cyclase with GAF sensor n=1 Tax=Thermincola potens (strain JR) TaxID=635013 RepID=D5XCW1_THEPJ|nr:sensor domain-containing diguanylate cyclase [Thermincola potens]ADG83637.1 diguanylate cyclase with GAF sensor [Thermincola potens JR]